jgi:catechol 2,3-dioxygenase-like lactoylglutathione lyase family enzyme
VSSSSESSLEFVFDHIHVFCTDLPASERWFVDGLGAKLLRRRSVSGTPASDVELAGATIFLRGPRPGQVAADDWENLTGINHIGLAVRDLDETARVLKERGIQFSLEPTKLQPDLRIAYVVGPDGLRIELLQRG